jgi:hypothetical protein
MSDDAAIIERLRLEIGYTATRSEAMEVINLLTLVNAAPWSEAILNHEPATIFVPPAVNWRQGQNVE